MSISITKDEKENENTIVIDGRFDFSMNSEFRKIVLVPEYSEEKFTIDMGAVEDIDSSALGMLLMLREKVGGDTAGIKITRCRPEIIEMLKMANFQTMFTIV